MRAVLAAALAAFVALTSASLFGQTTSDLPSSWVGTFRAYPTYVLMKVNLTEASDGTLKADVRLEPLIGRTGGPMGVFSTTARYDPASRSFEITPGQDAYRTIGQMVPAFLGVLDPSGNTIAGVTGAGNPAQFGFFILQAAGTEDELLNKARELAPIGPPRRAGFGGGGVSEDKLKRWAQRLLDEYPDTYPPAAELGALYRMALPLFDDAHFSAHFGKTFERMSQGELRGVYNTMQKIPFPRGNFPEEKTAGAARALERQFIWMTGQGTAQDVTFAVMARRAMYAWRQDMINRLDALQGTPSAFATIAAIEAIEGKALTSWWPSDRRAFAVAVVGNRTRLAGPMLKAQIDKLMASAEGLTGAQQIARVLSMAQSAAVRRGPVAENPHGTAARPTRSAGGAPPNTPGAGSAATEIATLLAMVSTETANAEKSRLETKLTALVSAEAAKDKAALASIGDGLTALERGSQWYAQLVQRYGTLFYQLPVQELLPDLARRRVAPLGAAETVLVQQIRTATSTGALQGLTLRYLAVPSDRRDPAGERVFAVADGKSRELAASELAAARAQAEAAREAASPCSKQPTDEKLIWPGEPSGRDLCKAVEAAYRAPQETITAMKQSCDHMDRNNVGAAMMCLMGQFGSVGGGPLLYLSSFEKLGCDPGEFSGQPGWVCDYISGVRSNNAMTRDLLNAFGDEVSTARFVKSASRGLIMVRE
jgi:hypothetical protein